MLNNVHSPGESVSDWKQALGYIKSGNERYCGNCGLPRDTYEADRLILKDGQKPFAVIVTCADSRVAPEIYLDQRLGDIFVIRNAGNIADSAVLGSVEYAVEHLKVPLVAVIGHSGCGAVTGAFGGGEFSGNLSIVINAIRAAVKGSENLNGAICANILHSVEAIKASSVVKDSGAKVVGALYDIESGKVSFVSEF